MAAPSEHGAAAVRLMAALAATWFLKAAAAAEMPDPTEWTPDECQCDADPAVVALCGPTTLYPPGVVPADWETVADQYYDILTNASLSEEERQAQYAPLVNQSGLDAANFSLYTTKYAALKRLPSASQLSSASSYCSVQYNNITGYMPCRCTGGGMAELGLTLEDPSSAQFEADSENAKQQVLTVLEAKLRETLGLWYTFVSIDAVQDTNVTVHVTFSALNREKIEQRFPDIEGLLGQPGNLSLANGSQITLGPSTLALRVLACSASSLTPTSDLPSEATAVGGGEVLAGARARFSCPDGQRFSSGARTVSRLCTSQEQLQAGTGDQLTCVNDDSLHPPVKMMPGHPLALLSQLLLVLLLTSTCHGRGTGAPEGACGNMVPQHQGGPQVADEFPYELMTPTTVHQGGMLSLTISPKAGAKPIKGFFVQARNAQSPNTSPALGKFVKIDPQHKAVDCDGSASGITHSNKGEEQSVTVTWEAPDDLDNNVVFLVSVVQDFTTFWAAIPSKTVTLVKEPTAEPEPAAEPEPEPEPNHDDDDDDGDDDRNSATAVHAGAALLLAPLAMAAFHRRQ